MSDWAQSRAVEARRLSGGLAGKGVGSWQRRFPRSKVGGMGFVTVIELGGICQRNWRKWEWGGVYDLSGCDALGTELRIVEEDACERSIIESPAIMHELRRFDQLCVN